MASHRRCQKGGKTPVLGILSPVGYLQTMKAEFTAVIEAADEGGYWAICPEVAGANGQGDSIEEAKTNLADAIVLILEDRLEDSLRGLPHDAIRETVAIG